MFLPALLLFIATACGAVMAYGTHPNWAGYAHGLEMIMLVRRLQWPLVVGSILCCMSLLGLVISGKKSAWWLIGLAPVLALFYHRFAAEQHSVMGIIENPPTLTADLATFLRDDDMVLGMVFKDTPFALPYAALYAQPVVILSDRENRALVMWSAFANRALAFAIERDLKARELEVVSLPANGLLLFNTKYGQFIYGVTGRTNDGRTPTGFERQLATTKSTWKHWRASHPATVVMVPNGPLEALPPRALEPYYKLPPTTRPAGSTPRVTLVGASGAVGGAVAVDPARVAGRVVNTSAGETKLLLLCDPQSRTVRAYERRVKDDLFPNFSARTDEKNPGVALIDSDSNSLWTAEGRCVAGELKGERLRALFVDDDVPLDVMRFWYPNLKVLEIEPEKVVQAMRTETPAGPIPKSTKPAPRHKTARGRH